MKLYNLALVTFLIVFGAGAAHAQMGNAFPYWFKLQDADVVEITKAEDRILAKQPIKAGLSESWKGAGTGNAGSVTILKVYEKKGAECIDTAYDFKFARAADSIRYVLPWCKFPDGSWKLVF